MRTAGELRLDPLLEGAPGSPDLLRRSKPGRVGLRAERRRTSRKPSSIDEPTPRSTATRAERRRLKVGRRERRRCATSRSIGSRTMPTDRLPPRSRAIADDAAGRRALGRLGAGWRDQASGPVDQEAHCARLPDEGRLPSRRSSPAPCRAAIATCADRDGREALAGRRPAVGAHRGRGSRPARARATDVTVAGRGVVLAVAEVRNAQRRCRRRRRRRRRTGA